MQDIELAGISQEVMGRFYNLFAVGEGGQCLLWVIRCRLLRAENCSMSASGVRREKAALSSGCKSHPANRSSRKQPEQLWR